MRILSFIFCMVASVSVLADEIGVPSQNVPELKQLHLFSGEWRAGLGNSNESISSKRLWVMDGYFLKHTFEVSGGVLRGTIYRGYNKDEKHYTMTFLDSQGNASFLIGYWNADLKTFTFEAVDDSVPVQRYESYFPDDKSEQWTIVYDSEKRNQISGVAHKIAE